MNKYLIVCFTSLILCQIIKFAIESIKIRKLRWRRLFNGSGGMPSSHSSFTSALTMTVFLIDGPTSTFFAISLVFSLIIMYDALGVRLESEKQAEAINHLVKKLINKPSKEGFIKLKEEIGHEPSEVLMGIVLGVAVSLIYFYFIF